MNAAGGSIEVHLDAPTGKLIGETAFITPAEGGSITTMPPPITAKLAAVTGLHDVYLVFKNDKAPAGQALFVLIDLEFRTSESANRAATATNVTPSSGKSAPNLADYAGKYKMTGMPFEYIEITPKNGRLHIKAGTNEGELTPGTQPDEFKGDNGTVFSFGRGADQKPASLALKVQGMTFNGVR